MSQQHNSPKASVRMERALNCAVNMAMTARRTEVIARFYHFPTMVYIAFVPTRKFWA